MARSLGFLASLILVAHVAQPAHAVEPIQPIDPGTIDDTVARTMKAFDVPGIAVAVVKDDKVIYSKGMGVAALNTRGKVDGHTLFGIASNTKAFVAASLAMLVEEKKLRWTDKVTDIIPEFKMFDPYVTAEFTIEDLLTHRSGLGLGAGDLMEFPDGSDFTRADVIRNLRYLKPVSSFRSRYDYDNQLYIVAGEVVARVSGMPWEDFVEQRILRPLGMNESAASRTRARKTVQMAMPHAAVDGGPVRQIDAAPGDVLNAAGGIVSNLDDMSKWVRMQLDGGRYISGSKGGGSNGGAKQLFTPASQAVMWAPHTILPVAPKTTYETLFAAYGYGWGMKDANGYKVVSHTGGLTGMVTQVTLVPKLKLGIIVLTNQQEGDAFLAITETILDHYLGVPRTDRVAEHRTRRDRQIADAAKVSDAARKAIAAAPAGPAPDSATYAGTYRDPVVRRRDLDRPRRQADLRREALAQAGRRDALLPGQYLYRDVERPRARRRRLREFCPGQRRQADAHDDGADFAADRFQLRLPGPGFRAGQVKPPHPGQLPALLPHRAPHRARALHDRRGEVGAVAGVGAAFHGVPVQQVRHRQAQPAFLAALEHRIQVELALDAAVVGQLRALTGRGAARHAVGAAQVDGLMRQRHVQPHVGAPRRLAGDAVVRPRHRFEARPGARRVDASGQRAASRLAFEFQAAQDRVAGIVPGCRSTRRSARTRAPA